MTTDAAYAPCVEHVNKRITKKMNFIVPLRFGLCGQPSKASISLECLHNTLTAGSGNIHPDASVF